MPSLSSAQSRHRDLRSAAVRKGAGFGVAARIISVTCTLVQVPIALKHLGTEGFGLWMTLTSIAGLLMIGDFGITLGAKTLLAQAHGRDDARALRALADDSLRQLVCIGAGLASLGVLLAWLVDWNAMLGVTSPMLAAQLPWALTGLAFSVGCSIPLSMGATLAAAVQLTWLQHLATALGGALTLVLVLVCAALKTTWLSLVLVILALPALMNAVLWWAMRRHLRWRGVFRERLDREQQGELRRLGRWFFIPQAGALFATMGTPVAIAAVGGPTAVTAFNVLQRIFGLTSQAHWMMFSALWPAYSEARARGDYAWMHEAYRNSWRATLGLFVPVVVVLAATTPWLVRLWLGNMPAELSPALLAVTAGWFILQLMGQPSAILLNGLGRVRETALAGLAGNVVSLAGMAIGGRIAGAPGVVAGMAAGYVLIGLPAVLVESRRALRMLRGTMSLERPPNA